MVATTPAGALRPCHFSAGHRLTSAVVRCLSMRFRRLPIEIESPEEMGYGKIACNLTESSVADMRMSDLGLDLSDLVLAYTDHRGLLELRERIAWEGDGLTSDHVLITAGAAAALFIVASTLLEKGDRIVVARPNYSTNRETPRVLGAEVVELRQTFEDGYRIDPDRLRELVMPGTKLVSLTVPHNPSGTTLSLDELKAIIRLVEERGTWLLIDETYREMAFSKPLPPAASLSDRVISVSSVSKAYGMPGVRIGWIICRDRKLMEGFFAAKEQIALTGSVLDEAAAARCLELKKRLLPPILAKTQENFALVRQWMQAQSLFEWVEPQGGAVCFPRFRPQMKVNVDRFYDVLNKEHKTYVGPGHWFDEDRRHFRIGFGWPEREELRQGLAHITFAAHAAA